MNGYATNQYASFPTQQHPLQPGHVVQSPMTPPPPRGATKPSRVHWVRIGLVLAAIAFFAYSISHGLPGQHAKVAGAARGSDAAASTSSARNLAPTTTIAPNRAAVAKAAAARRVAADRAAARAARRKARARAARRA